MNSPIGSLQDKIRLGALLYAFGIFLLATMDAAIKFVVEIVPVGQIWVLRSWFSLIPILGFILVVERRLILPALATKNLPLQVLRGLFGAASFLALVFAIRFSELSAVAAFALTAPLIMLFVGVAVLGERVESRVLFSAALGCVAAFLMVPTSSDIGPTGAVFAFLAAVFHALAVTVGRVLIRHDSGSSIALYTNLVACVVSVVFLAFEGWTAISLEIFALCALIGVLGGGSFLTLAFAMKHIEVARASVLEYSFYVWAAVFGAVLFAEYPSLAQIFSVAIIAYCGIFASRRTSSAT